MDHLADTNVLIRSIDRTHAMHPEATAALRMLLRSGERVCVTPQNIIEFWNVCTRPADRNGLGLSSSEADREVSELEGILALLPDVPAILPRMASSCCRSFGIGGSGPRCSNCGGHECL